MAVRQGLPALVMALVPVVEHQQVLRLVPVSRVQLVQVMVPDHQVLLAWEQVRRLPLLEVEELVLRVVGCFEFVYWDIQIHRRLHLGIVLWYVFPYPRSDSL